MSYINFIKKKISGREFKINYNGVELVYKVPTKNIEVSLDNTSGMEYRIFGPECNIKITGIDIVSGGEFFHDYYTMDFGDVLRGSIHINRVIRNTMLHQLNHFINVYRVLNVMILDVEYKPIKLHEIH